MAFAAALRRCLEALKMGNFTTKSGSKLGQQGYFRQTDRVPFGMLQQVNGAGYGLARRLQGKGLGLVGENRSKTTLLTHF